MQAYLAEFIGTMILIILGDGVVAGVLLKNSKAENSGWIVITLRWAMAVAIAVYCVGQFTTAPAYRATGPNLITEIIGTAVLLFGVLGIGANAGVVGGDHSAVIANGLNPLLVGFLVLGIGLSLGGPTGYAINPARDLGPRIAHAILPITGKGSSDWEYSWIPVVAPIIGALIGAGLFTLLGFGG